MFIMAIGCHCGNPCEALGFLTLLLCVGLVTNVEQAAHNEAAQSSGFVHFNNPKLLQTISSDLDSSYLYDGGQEAVDSRMIGGLNIFTESAKLGNTLRQLSNEMAVQKMQAIYDTIPFKEADPKLDDELLQLAEDIKRKFDNYLHVLGTNKLMVENLYQLSGNQHILTQPRDCCTLPNHQLGDHEEYKGFISQQYSCDMLSPSASFATLTAFNPGRNLTEVFQHNIQFIPSIKWQFFIAVSGVHNEFPAHNFNNLPYLGCKNMHDYRHREEYVWNVQPKSKRVVILLDHGNSLSANQLAIAKSIAKYILLSLSNQDKVSVVGLTGETVHMRDDACVTHHLVPLTDKARSQFISFIDSLQKTDTVTNHSLGFETAFSIIENSMALQSMPGKDIEPVLITYISRGLLSVLTESKDVLKVISEGNARLQNQVIINTYAVIDDGKPIMYEKKFLENIASQNFDLLSPRAPGSVKPGIMRSVNTTNDLSEVVGDFYTVFNYTAENQPHIFLPRKDTADEGLVMTITWPCFYEKKLIGVIGFDIRAEDVLEPITYFTHTDRNTYAFLIDKYGNTIMHPNMKRPILAKDQPMYTDISHYEDYPEFDDVRSMMLEHDEGVQRIEVHRYKDDEKNHMSQNKLLPTLITIRYAWRKIYVDRMSGDAPFIVVIRSIEDVFKLRDMEEEHTLDQTNMIYHRLDLLPTDSTCMHLKQLSTLDTSSLFLSASCFLTPYIHISEEETKRSVKGYLAYLKDKTDLIMNPGIKENIRKEVSAISLISGEWLKIFHSSKINENIVRRYVASTGGAMLMFPGTLLSKMYDPTNREWFRRALESPGKVTLTAPYLDVGGAGYIVTISHTVYEGKGTFHTPMDRVVAVMGIDISLGYFYKILLEQMPVCDNSHIRCFVMDDRGYLIAHEDLIEPNGRSPVEQQHITHLEPLVANDILNHRHFVKKSLCNSFSDRTIQRFYHFNTSVDGALTNLVHGEHCEKYVLTSIPGTNTFLGIVNKTCNMMRAFCPCSMVDRLCLNCKRMEQTECECPCECPLDMNYCSGQLLQMEDKNPSCPRQEEAVELATVSDQVSTHLPQCFHNKCSHRKTRRDCLGVVDCEWCVMEKDGSTYLKEPFCSTQRVCFAGVLGATTPYHDHIKEMLVGEENVNTKSTPVGPVAGGIMGSFLLLALMIYCYRQHRQRSNQAYMSSLADNHTRMSQLDHEFEEIDHSDDLQAGHTNIVLATFENPASMSPYRVSTNYRRPTGGDSDHGYSTMTPQEDSEQASTACLEPLIIGRDRYRPSSSSISKLSSGGMLPPPPQNHRQSLSPSPTANTQTQLPEPTTQLPPQTTVIPSPHHIMAPVTVHMVDSH